MQTQVRDPDLSQPGQEGVPTGAHLVHHHLFEVWVQEAGLVEQKGLEPSRILAAGRVEMAALLDIGSGEDAPEAAGSRQATGST